MRCESGRNGDERGEMERREERIKKNRARMSKKTKEGRKD